jgi:hypothetical protein
MLGGIRSGLAIAIWMTTISVMHLSLNVDWREISNDISPDQTRKLNVAYVPVT